jgi:hypothetical protein
MSLSAWMREPLWTRSELEKFWGVFQPQIKRLLDGELALPDPAPDLFSKGKRIDHKTKAIYCARIQTDLWTGRYSRAVANFKALKACLRLDEQDDLQMLKRIYMQPYRYRNSLMSSISNHYDTVEAALLG